MANGKKFAMKGPGGAYMETTAVDISHAWNNLRFRLKSQFGLSWYEAREFDHRDLHEVQ